MYWAPGSSRTHKYNRFPRVGIDSTPQLAVCDYIPACWEDAEKRQQQTRSEEAITNNPNPI